MIASAIASVIIWLMVGIFGLSAIIFLLKNHLFLVHPTRYQDFVNAFFPLPRLRA
jgi:hypothetical protein